MTPFLKKIFLSPIIHFFFLILLLIFTPFFKNGFIFSYDDLFFYPKIPYKLSYLIPNQTYILFFLEKINILLPAFLIQKIIWFSSFLIGSMGCFLLFGRKNKLTGYLAGIFFIFNPFVYERMVMGQVTIIFGLSLYPFIFYRLERYFYNKGFANLVIASILSGLAIMLFPHSIFILGLPVFLIFLYFSIKNKKYFKNITFLLLFFFFIFLFNLNWLKPNLNQQANLSQLSSGFNINDFRFYETSKGNINNIWLNVIFLNGHWGERSNFFKYVLDSKISLTSAAIILFIVLLGIIIGFKKKEKRLITFLACFLILLSYFLAIGPANKFTSYFSSLFYEYIPFYQGLREPQKWVGLLLLIYIFFISISTDFFIEIIKKKKNELLKFLLPVIFFLPMLNSSQILYGFNKQLVVSDFPKSWYKANQLLNQQPDDLKVIFLPWHFYVDLNFSGRKIVNPALGFFDKFTFIGNDINVDNTYYQYYSRELDFINNQLRLIEKDNCSEIKEFKKINIGYIILSRQKENEDYKLSNCSELKNIFNEDGLLLFKII